MNFIRRRAIAGLAGAVPLGLIACSPGAAPVRDPPALESAAPLRPIATVRDLMDGQIDPAADALWDAVAYVASDQGIEDRRPRTAADWQALRSQALVLIEATNLLAIPGRRVAAVDGPAGPGELRPAEIRRRIESGRTAFVQYAGLLRAAGLKALAAIDAEDPQALLEAGGVIDEACEACHVAYWYPDQATRGS